MPREKHSINDQLRIPFPALAAEMVGLLDLAGNGGCEAELAQHLARLLAAGELPDLKQLQLALAPRPALFPSVTVELPALAIYDDLLEVA